MNRMINRTINNKSSIVCSLFFSIISVVFHFICNLADVYPSYAYLIRDELFIYYSASLFIPLLFLVYIIKFHQLNKLTFIIPLLPLLIAIENIVIYVIDFHQTSGLISFLTILAFIASAICISEDLYKEKVLKITIGLGMFRLLISIYELIKYFDYFIDDVPFKILITLLTITRDLFLYLALLYFVLYNKIPPTKWISKLIKSFKEESTEEYDKITDSKKLNFSFKKPTFSLNILKTNDTNKEISFEERLTLLKSKYEFGLINEEEYQKLRNEIIDNI